MYTLVFIFIFLLGTIIGSFLNVVIYRFNTGKSITKGRSMCMTCNRTLRWYELIPVFSFLIQSGKCRRCASTISHQYPLVELGTGLVFTLIAFHFLYVLFFSQLAYTVLVIFYSFIFSLLIVILVYDIRHKIIPDRLVYIFCILAFLSVYLTHSGIGPLLMTPKILAVLAGPLLAAPFALLWLVSKGTWMGLGDAKLILGLGWLLGPWLGLSMLTLSFWIGALVSLGIMFFSRRRMTMKTEIPFAPFLIFSTFVVFLFTIDIFRLATLFYFF